MLIFLLLIFIVIIIVFIVNALFCKQSKFTIGGNSKIFEKRYFITIFFDREVYTIGNDKIIFEHFPACEPFIIIQSQSIKTIDAYGINFKENPDINVKLL